MKYHDNQTARRGDKIQAGTWGTCRVIRVEEHRARIANILTKEKWDMDCLRNFDLLERKPKTESIKLDSPYGNLTVGWK